MLVDPHKVMLEGELWRPVTSVLFCESMFVGGFITWMYLNYGSFNREFYKGTFYQMCYFFAMCFALTLLPSAIFIAISPKTPAKPGSIPSTLWLMTVYEFFKTYLVYWPRRPDYDLICFKTDNITLAHIFLCVAFLLSFDLFSLSNYVFYAGVLIVGWSEYGLKAIGAV